MARANKCEGVPRIADVAAAVGSEHVEPTKFNHGLHSGGGGEINEIIVERAYLAVRWRAAV
jgi:hypothetical protein